MRTSRATYYNPAGALPFIYQSLLWLVPETVAVLLILLALPKTTRFLPDLPSRILLSMVVLLAMELAKRRTFFATHSLRIWFAIGPTARRVIRPITPVIPLTVIALIVIYTVFLVIQGASLPRDTSDQSGAPLVSSVLAFATAFVAIFIAGAALVVELVSGPYTSGFGPPFVRHPLFILVGAVAIGVLVLDLYILRHGWNEPLLQAAFASGILLVFSFPFLMKLFLDYANAPNIISFHARQLQTIVRRAIPRVRTPTSLLAPHVQQRIPASERLSLLYSVHILGVVPTPRDLVPPLQVPAAVAQHLKDRTRPFLNCALRAIREDRRDILLAATSALRSLAASYILARRNYLSDHDELLEFLVTEIDVLYAAALEVPNQQYTADLVELISSIAFSALDLTAGQMDPTTNAIASMYGKHLTDMALRAAHLHNTSAPSTAIDAAGDLAARLIGQHAITTAVFGIVEPLGKTADVIAKVPGLWPAVLAQRSLHALVKALSALQRLAIEQPMFSSDLHSENVADAMLRILRSAFSVDRDVISLNHISAPVVGPVWRDGNLVDLAAYTLRKCVSYPPADRPRIVSLLSALPRVLHLGGTYAVPASHASDFASASSEIVWLAIPAVLSSGNQEELDALREFISQILAAGEAIVGAALKSEDSRDFDLFLRLSPTYAFLAHFASAAPNTTLRQLLLDSVRRLLELYIAAPSHTGRVRTRSELRRYLMMFGAWILGRFPDDPLYEDIARAIASDVASWQSGNLHFGGSEFERLGYPTQSLTDRWYIIPSRIWPSKDKTLIGDALNDSAAYRKYAQFVASLASHY